MFTNAMSPLGGGMEANFGLQLPGLGAFQGDLGMGNFGPQMPGESFSGSEELNGSPMQGQGQGGDSGVMMLLEALLQDVEQILGGGNNPAAGSNNGCPSPQGAPQAGNGCGAPQGAPQGQGGNGCQPQPACAPPQAPQPQQPAQQPCAPAQPAQPAQPAPAQGNACSPGGMPTQYANYQFSSDTQKQEYLSAVKNNPSLNPSDVSSYDPLTLDVGGKGITTSNQTTQFDMTGNGQKQTVNDLGAGDGVLTIDSHGDGKSGEDGTGLLGNNTDLSRFGIQGHFKDGFDALKAIAQNAKQKGLIQNDQQLNAQELAVLQKNYGLEIKMGSLNNQAQSLASAGVNSIDLSGGATSSTQNFDGKGNNLENQAGATFTRADGTQGTYADTWLQNHAA
jgi:hypothetical protein